VRGCRRSASTRLNADGHFNILTEFVEHRHKTINRKASKLRLPDVRKIRRRKARQFMSAANLQLLVIENAERRRLPPR
jgi:hypothetical protein